MKKHPYTMTFVVKEENVAMAELLFDMLSDIIEGGHELVSSSLKDEN
jgi:hypothetical protein